MVHIVENLIETELGESSGLSDMDTERANRALGPKPVKTARPTSMVVRLLKYTTKEKTIRAP